MAKAKADKEAAEATEKKAKKGTTGEKTGETSRAAKKKPTKGTTEAATEEAEKKPTKRTTGKKTEKAADRDEVEEAAKAILGMASKVTKKAEKAAAGASKTATDRKATDKKAAEAIKAAEKRTTGTAVEKTGKKAAETTDKRTEAITNKADNKTNKAAGRKESAEAGKERSQKRKHLKKSNGYGSVYKLNDRRRKPWAARATIGWTDDGKQIKQLIGYFDKKEEAEDALLMHRITPVTPKANISFKELYEEWSESKYEMISKSTVDNYKAAWKYLSKYGSTPFKELRTAHFQAIIHECINDGKSRSSMEKIKALATSLYTYAMQNDIVNKNYAEFIAFNKVEQKKREPFTETDLQKMFANADRVEWIDTILILCYTGMRISELLGLTRFNVDMENQIITGGIKTDAGKDRTIPIHPKISRYIRKWYDKGGNYLICNDKGGRISASSFREDKYYPALEKLELKKLSPHSCRHTFGTLLSKAGANTKAIQELIGHSDYALTANVYTHTDLEELWAAMKKI